MYGSASIRKHSGRLATVSPTAAGIPAALAPSDETRRALSANDPTPTARIKQLQAPALASDITDLSTETVDPGREVVNAGYMTMLAQRGLCPRDQALLGSDDSTDAGGGSGPVLNYAVYPRGLASIGGVLDRGGK